MNDKILNLIISFSLLGIVALSLRDYFLVPKKTSQAIGYKKSAKKLVITPSVMAKKDLKIPCQHNFFTFTKNTEWVYKITSVIKNNSPEEESSNSTQTTIHKILTITVKNASDSSVLIESHFQGEKTRKTTKVVCRESGLYGFFLPIIPDNVLSNLSTQSKIMNILPIDNKLLPTDNDWLFLPDASKISQGSDWKSNIKINTGIPLANIAKIPFTLSHEVTEVKKGTVPRLGPSEIFTVKSSLGLPGFLTNYFDNTRPLFSYEVAPKVGIIRFITDLEVKNIISVKSDLKLISFTTPELTPSSE